jgi:outer membrane receptor protein involved in Fe transport
LDITGEKPGFSAHWGDGIQGEVALWAKNLSDRSHIDNIVDFDPGFGNLRVVNYGDPRTFGVTVTARW